METRDILSTLPHLTGVQVREKELGQCQVTLDTDLDDSDAICRSLFFAFSRAQRAILRMSTAQASLEDIFIELTQQPAEPEGPKGKEGEEA